MKYFERCFLDASDRKYSSNYDNKMIRRPNHMFCDEIPFLPMSSVELDERHPQPLSYTPVTILQVLGGTRFFKWRSPSVVPVTSQRIFNSLSTLTTT